MSDKQAPIHSGFDFHSTAAEVIEGIDLAGKIAIVTGGGSGIGVETVRALASAGAHVVVPARDPAKAAMALRDIEGIELATLALTDPVSIKAFAQVFLRSGRPLHILVNNAGVMFAPFGHDARGYETQFATNHLGHFELTFRLWPALVQAQGARVVALSSRGHRFGPIDFEDINFDRRPYNKFVAYGQSKTANILFAVGADARGKTNGVRAFALHPGRVISTNLSRFMSAEELAAVPTVNEHGQPFDDPASYVKSVEQGAATSVWCATSPKLDDMGGLYCEECDVASVVPADSQGLGVRRYAIDPELADRLWSLSERMTAVSLTEAKID
jgi:NAD(P)-dependent dehydrogenase (short-subunit alcohol dehydrogenase family)